MLIGSDLEELKAKFNGCDSSMALSKDLENLIDSGLLQKMLSLKDLNFLGPVLPEQAAKDIAHGVIDPISLNPYFSNAVANSLLNKNANSPALHHRPKSLELGHMLEKTSGEKYYKVARPVNRDPTPPKKSGQLSIVNFVNVNGRKSNVEISQKAKPEKLGEKFVLDFLKSNEDSNSLQFRQSKRVAAPYKPPKMLTKSMSLDVRVEQTDLSDKTTIIGSATEEIKEADMHLEVSDTFGHPLGFLRKHGKKRHYPARCDQLSDEIEAKKENTNSDPEATPVFKKAKTSLDGSASKRKMSDEVVVELGTYSKLMTNLGSFAFKQQVNRSVRLDEGLSVKDPNLKTQVMGFRFTSSPVEKPTQRISSNTQNTLSTKASDNTTQNEESQASLVVRKLYRQFSDGIDSGKTNLSQRFRELVDTNIEFEKEEQDLVEIDKKLQRLELLFGYKKPVIDFKQALENPV